MTIDSATPTFGFSDGANLISAAFTGNMLTITQTNMCCGAGGWQMTFADPSFTGFTKKSGDTFTFGGLMSSYDKDKQTFTVSWQGDPSESWKYSASFAVPLQQVPTPEPSGLLLFGSGGTLARRSRPAQMAALIALKRTTLHWRPVLRRGGFIRKY